ncbi:MAG TPA: hypothetical protein PLU10_07905 [Chitinophagaceae bacterium]|nr:hypothetical protein [Chitinophagaceae bacterium]
MVANIKTLSFLGELPQNQAFEVPDGYFEKQDQTILEELEVLKITNDWPRVMPFELPSNYFQAFEDSLKTKLNEDLSLPTTSKNGPFQVPAGYFEEFEMNLKAKLNDETKPTILQVKRFKWSTLALAASVLLFVTIGFSLFNSNSVNTTNLASMHQAAKIDNALNAITPQEIDAYIKLHQSEFSADLSLETNENINVDLNLLEQEIMESQLKNLTVEELNTYL